MNNLKRIAILGLTTMFLVGSVCGCAITDTKGSDSTEVTNISDEEVIMTASLDTVTYEENEEKISDYYKKAMDKEGNLCYLLNADGEELYVPLDKAVVYTMEEGKPYVEKVAFSYDIDGKKFDTEQYRIYVS